MRKTLVALSLAFLVAPLAAQDASQRSSRSERFLEDCERQWRDRDQENFCEIRETRLSPTQGTLLVDGRDNGGVSFHGWDRNEVLVRALIGARADSRAEAQDLAKQVRVVTDSYRIRADGPGNRRHASWWVSYEVWVPRRTNLEAETHNGGVSVEGVEGRMSLHAVNGGIALRDVAGDVRAETTNGGVAAYLSGNTWRGQGLDLETTNGGVTLEIPRNFNADLETGTVNGGMNIDFPITVQGSIGRRINTKLGNGGPRLRLMTTNGGVRIREK